MTNRPRSQRGTELLAAGHEHVLHRVAPDLVRCWICPRAWRSWPKLEKSEDPYLVAEQQLDAEYAARLKALNESYDLQVTAQIDSSQRSKARRREVLTATRKESNNATGPQ